MKKVNFLFGIHCHQPVGNFEHIFEEAYHKAYLPFIKTLESHPRIKFAAHYSGVLYDWFKEKHPEFMDLLKKLVKRGQLELLSGGYYEPILSIIPDQDKLGQIETTNQFIKENFGRAPAGMWLTERIWEPTLPKILSEAGIEYSIVDDYHFMQAGLSQEKLSGYYVAEQEGKTLKLFPIHKKLRDLIPFKPPEELLAHLQSVAQEDQSTISVFLDDGEKFGFRDGSYEWNYEKGYLEKLLSLLEENSDWIKSTTFSEYLEEYPPKGRVYLPVCSYEEMMKWSGGFFQNFFMKYPEANNLHKKMLQVSNRLHTIKKGKALIGEHEKDKRLKEAIKHLYKGECNCAYWHGLYGGIYLSHLRQALYSHLICAEREIEKFGHGAKPYAELTLTDFDKDGKDEVILSNNHLSLYFSPSYGGSLFELDYKPKAYNLVNVLSRKKEPYHQKPLVYDKYQRFCLLDHFLAPNTTLNNFASGTYSEAGDFIAKPYSSMPRRKEKEVVLIFSRNGLVENLPVTIEKTITLLSKQSLFNSEYKITNNGEELDEFWFGVEFNLAIADKSCKRSGEIEEAGLVKLVDEWGKFEVLLELDKAALLWHFPIETVFRTEEGLNKSYQGTVIFPSWKFSLEPNQSFRVKITLRIEE